MAKRSAEAMDGGSTVFVRGFDHGTAEDMVNYHMSQCGTVQNIKMISQGAAEVTYGSADEAAAAIANLHKSTIEGNSRYIDVLLRSEDGAKRFNSGQNGWWQNQGGQYSNFTVDKSGGELGEFIGEIKSFNPIKGFGFIISDGVKAQGRDEDIFVHGSMIKNFKQGMTVRFTCVINKDNKPVAVDLKSGGGFGGNMGGQGMGQAGGQYGQFNVDKTGGELGEFLGEIKSFNASKGYGFIVSEGVQGQGYDIDIFVHGQMIKNFKPGMTVRFTCVINKDSKPVAIDLKSGGNFGGQGTGQTGGQYGHFTVDSSGGELGEFFGEIKSFSANKGYGFIVSEGVQSQGYDIDIFVHGQMIKNFKPGMTVRFTCVINKDNKPVAIDLKSGLSSGGNMDGGMGGKMGGMSPWMDGGMSPWMDGGYGGKMGGGMGCMNPMMAMMMGKGMGPMMMGKGKNPMMMMGKGKNPMMMKGMMQNQNMWQEDKMTQGWQSPGQYGHFNIDNSGGELGECIGQIKSFNDKKGYGFIISEDVQGQGFNDDIFVHGQMIKNFKQGMTVRFTCVINKENKPVAINLKSGIANNMIAM